MDIGCIIIGALFIVFAGANLSQDVKVLKFLEDDKYDDEENLEQKRRVRGLYYFWICHETLFIATGIAVIFAAAKGWSCCLKGCACAVIVLGLAPVIRLAIIGFKTSTFEVVAAIFTLLVLLYFSYVLWSYAGGLLMDSDEEEEERVNPVANLFRGRFSPSSEQQYGHYPPPYQHDASSYYPPGYHGPAGQVGGKSVYIAPPEHQGYPGPSPTGSSRGNLNGPPRVGYRSSARSVHWDTPEDGNDPARPPRTPQGYPQGPPGAYPQGPYPIQPQAPYPGYPGPYANPQQTSGNTDPLQAARMLGMASMLGNFGRR